jgi:flavin reductase (DIM6/NTAB) family NADH-FMN oxidoreductase RutF
MREFATGVTVVATVRPDGTPYGLTVNSFTSLSLEPPLVLVCLSRQLSGLDLFREGRPFAVNVLGAAQRWISDRFARASPEERFRDVAWRPGATGAPLLEGCLAVLECRVEQWLPGGDHVIVLGAPVAGEVRAPADDPLVFFRGGYTTIARLASGG